MAITSERLLSITQELNSGNADVIREWRDYFLSQSDWTQFTDSPLDADQKAAWATYRQALRDVTAQEGFPTSITWPTAPGA
jgi:hypothetical protein